MKQIKRGLVSLVLMLFLIPAISAIDIGLLKQTYNPGETLQAEITGNFASLKEDNIFIYDESIPHSTPVIKDLTKQGSTYYFYALLPNKPGNYSLRIEEVDYIKAGKLVTETIYQPFLIANSTQTVLSVNPGFLFTSDLIMRVKSYNGDMDVTATLSETGESESVSLIEEIEETIRFSSKPISKKSSLNVGGYTIPVFSLDEIINITIIEEVIELEFLPDQLSGTIIPNKNYLFDLILNNYGEENLTHIRLTNDFGAIINPWIISSLDAGKNVHVNITFTTNQTHGNFSGIIISEIGNKTIEIPVLFDVTQVQGEENITGASVTETLGCLEIGNLCLENQECDGDTTSSLEGVCCLGNCVEIKKSNYSWIIGLVLVGILVVMGFIAYKRLKMKKPKSAQEILRERTNKYKEKLKGDPNQVSKKLDRI